MTDVWLRRLLDFASELQCAATFEQLVSAARAEVSRALGYEHAWLLIADDVNTGKWRLVDSAGAARGDAWKSAPLLRVEGDAMLEAIVARDAAIVVEDARTDPRTDKRLVERLGNRTIINVPLRLVDSPFGAFGTGTFGDEGCKPPTPDQLEYLVGMASQLSAAAGRIRSQERRRADDALLRTERSQQLEHANCDLRALQDELASQVEARTAELQRANDALGKSERRFRRLAESGIVGILVSDGSGTILEANDAFLEIVGYSREDLAAGRVSGATLNVAKHEGTDNAARAELKAHGVAHLWEKELAHKNGSRVPVLVGIAALDETKENLSFVVDLSERRRAEAATRESDAQKTAVMEAAIDAIVLMDHEGKILEFNPAAEAMFGYSRDEAVHRVLAELLIPPALREQHARGLERYLKCGEARVLDKRVEMNARRKDGTEFPAELAIVRIRAEGAPIFTGYIRDITERRQAAEAEIFRREKEVAQAANRELEAFSYSVAHDLRGPLRGISGFTSAFLEDYGDKIDEGGRAQLNRVTAGAARMAQTIDALLALSRFSRAEPKRETVDLTRIATEVIEQLRAADPTRAVHFFASDKLAAEGDPRLLRVVLENLLGNAWKFTRNRAGARIEFGCTELPEGRAFYVRDNGAGFSMEYAHRLFAAFQRLHSAEQFEGTGVGLATVQRIVHRHAGRVWAEGQENEGATFLFTLPLYVGLGGRSWPPKG